MRRFNNEYFFLFNATFMAKTVVWLVDVWIFFVVSRFDFSRAAGLITESMLTSANKPAYKNLGVRKLKVSRTQN